MANDGMIWSVRWRICCGGWRELYSPVRRDESITPSEQEMQKMGVQGTCIDAPSGDVRGRGQGDGMRAGLACPRWKGLAFARHQVGPSPLTEIWPFGHQRDSPHACSQKKKKKPERW